MKQVIDALNQNSKVDEVRPYLKPTLSDKPDYDYVRVVIKTRRNLYEWAKGFTITPVNDEYDKFVVSSYLTRHPDKTLLKDMYNNFKVKDWEPIRYAHEKSYLEVKVGLTEINQLVNWWYGSIN
jgi:hypothetical protein